MIEWRAVPGYEGLYEASSDGQLRSLPRATTTGRVLKQSSGRPKPGVVPYLGVRLHRGDGGKRVRTHVIIAATFLGPRPAGQQIRHLNGDHADNRVENLAYGTAVENAADTTAHGRRREVTHCPEGHEYSTENTYRKPSQPNARRCRTCRRAEASREYLQRKAG